MISIGALILLLALLILFYENATATKGYQLRQLENDRSESYLEQEVLNMQIAQAQALQSLKDDPQVAGMVPAKNIRFIIDPTALAQSSSSSSSSSVLQP